jgi:hypothetical protein
MDVSLVEIDRMECNVKTFPHPVGASLSLADSGLDISANAGVNDRGCPVAD